MKQLKVQQVAELLAVSNSHVRNLIRNGELAAVDIASRGSSKRDWRVKVSDIAEFQAERYTAADSEFIFDGVDQLCSHP